jgi:hypothetical protein
MFSCLVLLICKLTLIFSEAYNITTKINPASDSAFLTVEKLNEKNQTSILFINHKSRRKCRKKQK